jgi:signal recognition particle subunit SRP54
MANRINVPVFGDPKNKDAVKVVGEGLKQFPDKDLIIVDTAGRHKEEHELIKEMKALEQKIKPDEIVMVIDGTIGQQALIQAKTFHEATPIGAILVTKLDGSARGGGALSAVAATGAPIKFIGTGEKIEDIEAFVPSRFVGRLLGMGDLETLLEKVKEAEIHVPQKKAKAILSGKFTLTDMYDQFEAVKGMGPFRKVLQMLPGMSANIPEEMLNTAEGRLEKWRVIIQSMRPEEKDNPKLFNSSRVRRVARGSGTSEKDVKELLKQYVMMRKMMKMFKRKKKLPFNLGQGFPADFK